MQNALAQFRQNLKRAKDIAGLAERLGSQTTVALDLSDLFRASLVLAVSALDHFIHELARKGMLAIANGARTPTDAYLRFSVSLATNAKLMASPKALQPLDDEIRDRHGYLSFQDPNKIADALRLISTKELWKEVGALLGLPGTTAKARLKIVVDRRNQIAHEADMDPTAPGIRWPIGSLVATEAIEIIETTANAIYATVTAK